MLTIEQLNQLREYAESGMFEQDEGTVLKPLTDKEKAERDKILQRAKQAKKI